MREAHILLPDDRSLIGSFWVAAHWVWKRRATAKSVGFPFSEETVTETVLLDLATEHPLDIQIIPLNKREEGKIGADWEWLFFSRDNKKFVRSLVQAKVLDDSDNEYAHIDRTIGNTGIRQIDRLLERANGRGIPALYAFYNHLRDPSRVPTNACAFFACTECWGCSVAPADHVRAYLPSKKFDDLRLISMPWHCLLCPETDVDDQATIPEKAAAGLLRLYRRAAERTKPNSPIAAPPLEFRRDPPEYFYPARQIRSLESVSQREAMLQRLASENPGVDGLFLITDESGYEGR